MINATQIRTGIFLKINNELYSVLKMHHVTPGKGNAVVQTDLRNLRTGVKINQRFRSTETVEEVYLQMCNMNFLYQDGSHYHFMNPETFEQVELPESMLEDVIKYLKPEVTIQLHRYEGNPVSVSIASRISFEVTQCDPPTKGMAGATKEAVLENGNVVKVPLFIKVGDKIRVDTATNSYLEKDSSAS
ncbi:MAG: elongation factor P [Deltaproteobacteria bacterium]|nr:elongation factor P [Deltaproteobacteria bacterium]